MSTVTANNGAKKKEKKVYCRKTTKKYFDNKMERKKLERDEKDIVNSFENDEWQSVKNKREVTKYQAIAQTTLKKAKRVNIRISERDLELLQERALREGIPYQTLMSSVLHKYVTGVFSEQALKQLLRN